MGRNRKKCLLCVCVCLDHIVLIACNNCKSLPPSSKRDHFLCPAKRNYNLHLKTVRASNHGKYLNEHHLTLEKWTLWRSNMLSNKFYIFLRIGKPKPTPNRLFKVFKNGSSSAYFHELQLREKFQGSLYIGQQQAFLVNS